MKKRKRKKSKTLLILKPNLKPINRDKYVQRVSEKREGGGGRGRGRPTTRSQPSPVVALVAVARRLSSCGRWPLPSLLLLAGLAER